MLPPDAEFKGYEEVVVQDVVVHTDNVLFRKEKFYSPSQRKIYLAELPPGYQGEFGPGVRAMVIIFAFACQMTEPKILGTGFAPGGSPNLRRANLQPANQRPAPVPRREERGVPSRAEQ